MKQITDCGESLGRCPAQSASARLCVRCPRHFLDEWSGKREEARRDRDRLSGEILATHQAGRPHETLLTAGQTAGGIKEILPVAEIMQRLVAETEGALSWAVDFR